MTEKPTYPTITDAQLVPFRALEAQLGQFPDILDRSDCPYPPHIKSLMRRLTGDATVAREVTYTDDDLVRETAELYNEVRLAGQTLKSTDAKDQMAVLKTSSDLLTKLMTLREKAVNIREMSRFQKSVIEVLETVITPDQRSEFMEKMGKILDV